VRSAVVGIGNCYLENTAKTVLFSAIPFGDATEAQSHDQRLHQSDGYFLSFLFYFSFYLTFNFLNPILLPSSN